MIYLVSGNESKITFLLLIIEENKYFDVTRLQATCEVYTASIPIFVVALKPESTLNFQAIKNTFQDSVTTKGFWTDFFVDFYRP